MLIFEGQIDAISKAQAVIEFDLDGTIITANDNFLNALGYTLSEIQGQHHRMFAPEELRNSAEYAVFWQKLNRGEFEAGEYKRIAKGGREIWIQASYNPIMDASGKPYKVVKFATDITQQKRANANFEGQINAISKAQAVIEFNLDGTIITANDNFLNTLGYALQEIQGQHHSMFAPEELKNSSEYTAFWQKLNRGEFETGEYKRIAKGGREIWIQASYNPILDANGKPYKVVKLPPTLHNKNSPMQTLKAKSMPLVRHKLLSNLIWMAPLLQPMITFSNDGLSVKRNNRPTSQYICTKGA